MLVGSKLLLIGLRLAPPGVGKGQRRSDVKLYNSYQRNKLMYSYFFNKEKYLEPVIT